MNSRITLLVCVVLTLVSSTIYAEEGENGSKRVIVGSYLGIDFATIGGTASNTTSIDLAYRTGFAAGASLIVRLTRNLSAQTELGFAIKGNRANGAAPSASSTRYIGYLEIPVLARASVLISETVEPYGYVGPALGIRLDADAEFDDGRFYEENHAIEPLDLGLMLGTGAAVKLGRSGALTFDVRYNHGLRDLLTQPVEGTVLNRVIYFTVGYQTDLSIFSGDR